MKDKYDRRLIWDYVNGCYIENVHELENDYKFMMEIIRITRDKNMYNLCSGDIKSNYEFVKFMVYTFKDDKDFINDIASEYLNKVNEEDFSAKELVFIMCDIYDKYKDKENYLIYFVKRSAISTCERVSISTEIYEEEDLDIKRLMGMGFILFLTREFGKSKVMIDYVAKVFLEEIFYENDLSIEELIHVRFSSLDKLNKFGIKNFIFSYVGEFDGYLATYLSANMNLIKDIEKNIAIVINNWDNYLKMTLLRKEEIFSREAFDLIDEYTPRYTYREICAYIDSLNLDLPVKLKDFEDEDELEIIDNKNMELSDYICIKKIIELAKEIYLSPVIDSSDKDDYYFLEEDTKKCKILRFVSNEVEDN